MSITFDKNKDMKDTINIWTPELPDGYGAFDEAQNQTEEDFCEYCGLLPEQCECYSCCGDLLDKDIMICPTCKEHC